MDRMAAGGWDNQQGESGQDGSTEATESRRPSPVPKFVPWHFEQNLNEAVFVPAGCPHQVSVHTNYSLFAGEMGLEGRI